MARRRVSALVQALQQFPKCLNARFDWPISGRDECVGIILRSRKQLSSGLSIADGLEESAKIANLSILLFAHVPGARTAHQRPHLFYVLGRVTRPPCTKQVPRLIPCLAGG